MEVSIDNKQKILGTALELFSEKGFDGVGVQMLCEKSGITKPTLYYYFGNKDGVLEELLKINYDNLNSMVEKNSIYNPNPSSYQEDVFPVLANLVRGYFNFAKQNEQFYKMVLVALFSNSGNKELIKTLNNHQYKIIENMFEKMSLSHRNMHGHQKRLAWTFIGMINTYIGLGSFPPETQVVHQFMHGIFS